MGFYLLWKPTRMSIFMLFTSSSSSERTSRSEVLLEKDVMQKIYEQENTHAERQFQ